MAARRAFISFDYDHDEDLRVMLAGQAKNPATPFVMQNWSVKEPMTGDWKAKVRSRIRSTDLTIVICGAYTHTATGVATELTITREEGKPYFLLWGRPNAACMKPTTANASDKIYRWTWDNLKALIEGAR
jgi:Thoeris protein ThsB, TIR-like domain